MAEFHYQHYPHLCQQLLRFDYYRYQLCYRPLFTNDAYYAGVLPLFMTVAESISYPAMSVCVAILLIRDSMQQVSPAQSRPWQMSAMLGVEYIDCMKALLPPLTIQIVLQIIVAVATGAIAI